MSVALVTFYARVLHNHAERAALKAADRKVIFREQATGGRLNRPELDTLFNQLRIGNVVAVCKLNRLPQLPQDMFRQMERIQEKKASFCSLRKAIETTAPAARMMTQIITFFAEFERTMLKEHTQAGLDSACNGEQTAAATTHSFGVHPTTVSRLLNKTPTALPTFKLVDTIEALPRQKMFLFRKFAMTFSLIWNCAGHWLTGRWFPSRAERRMTMSDIYGAANAGQLPQRHETTLERVISLGALSFFLGIYI